MKKRKISHSIFIFVLCAIMISSFTTAAFAMPAQLTGGSPSAGSTSSAGLFDKQQVIADLKNDFIKSLNKDLVKNISDYSLSGKVNAIITFSEDSLVKQYNQGYSAKQTLSEFLAGSKAKKLSSDMRARQDRVASKLVRAGLVSEVKYGYSTILDGIYVSTTFANIAEIANYDGVARIILSNTYKPSVATENAVNVYDTGIFNSSDVSYTGKGTIVAILDTGCDYTHTAFTTHQVQQPLYDRNKIAELLPNTLAYGYDNTLEPREVYYGNVTKDKIAWGYDYADKDPDVMPFGSEHGTHVAGIIGGKDDTITGVALDTQLAIMKVFSDYKEGADDGDILAALEDCVTLGVDAINMSLGTSCGFTREVDERRKNEIYGSIEEAGISLVVAASNDYSSAYGSEFGNTNKTRNPDSATVGAPSTYSASMSVASINGNKDKYMLANGSREVFFLESFNQAAKEYNFFEMLGITPGNPKTFDYVAVPGYGHFSNYLGLDMTGKIALVKRGDISFEDKVRYAAESGAAAVIIYNNVFGDIVMTVGNDVKIPVVSIGKDDGDVLANVNAGKENEGRGTLEFVYENQAGPFMSDFSSWGPNPDLTLKPEITAHGGNILSAIPGGGYDKLSGTSMACPNMCGITILIRQYVKENFPDFDSCQVRDLVNQLCMSTATIAMDKAGNPYSPRKQGAGIADILKATTTNAYLFVEGKGKTKLELGDDPARTGKYTMTISLRNLSSSAVSYKLGMYAMTETLSSSDTDYVAERAYMLGGSTAYSAVNGKINNGVITVEAGQTAQITAVLTLSTRDKTYLNQYFENGMYVEGFLTLDNLDENGVDLNAPFLAFYGNWTDAPIFDEDYYVVETEAYDGAIDDKDKIKADYYATTPLGKYYYDYIIPLGSYVYAMPDDYTPIPATAEHAAVSYYKDCISGIYAVFTGLLRGAKELNIQIVDTVSGKTVWEKTEYNCYKAHNAGVQYPYVCDIDLDMANTKTGEVFGDNNTHYQVTMTAKLDFGKTADSNVDDKYWQDGVRNVNDTYQFSFYIDYEAPIIVDSEFRVKYDKTLEENRYYVDLTVYDNHYAMSLRPVVLYDYVNEKGETKKTFASLSEYPIPIYQEKRGTQTKISVEITDYLDAIRQSDLKEGICFYIDDYAMNSNVCYVPFPEVQNESLNFHNQTEGTAAPTIELMKGQTFDLTTIMYDTQDSSREIVTDYLQNLTWTSSNPSVVAVNGGKIEALQENTGIRISVKGETWTKAKEILVNVKGVDDGSSSSQDKVSLEEISFTSYETLYAYNGDIDTSEIGRTGGINYFGGNYTLNFYPGESIRLNYEIKPWNLPQSRYQLRWTSSNPAVATVDDKGVVEGKSEGRARVFLNIVVDGKESILQASCIINIKSEFVIENRELVAYKGLGGVVEIPDDEGIMYIGSFAFCHYNLDNEKEVDDKYDLDDKKEPLGNNSVTKVIIPKGVQEIRKFAFYNCEKLVEVVLGEDCKKIDEYAFYNDVKLETINFENVKTVSDYAFAKCSLLDNVLFDNVNFIGKFAFAECKSLSSANLADMRRSGEGAFSDCPRLRTVILGERANISAGAFKNSAVMEIVLFCATIPDEAFYNCTQLTTVTVAGDLTYLGISAFENCTKLSSFDFMGECEYIGDNAFYNCATLAAMTLPNGTVSFGDNVFGRCSRLRTLTLNDSTSIDTVGALLFNGLDSSSLTIKVSEFNDSYVVNNGVLFSKDGTKLIWALPRNTFNNGTYTLPAKVREICDGAFSANKNLVTLDASASALERIGNSAFAYCNNLATVRLPANELSIGDRAFAEAVNLSVIDLSNAKYIGDFAFYNTAVTSLHFAKNVNIGFRAFSAGNSTVTGGQYVSRLTNIYLDDGATLGDYAFADSALIAVAMPENGGVTVGAFAFFRCIKLETIDLTKAAALGDYAFARCSALKSVDLGNLTEVPEGCFSGCASLENVTAYNVVTVGDDAFSQYETQNNLGMTFVYEGPIITEINLPLAENIGKYAFYGCMKLITANIPNATYIGEGAFQFCEKMSSVNLSPRLTVINNGVFYGCEALDLATIDFSNIKSVGIMAFMATKAVATLNLDSMEVIGSQAFGEAERRYSSQDGAFEYIPSQNPVLKVVNAPNLIKLDDNAFYGNGALTTVNAPLLQEIGDMVFTNTAIEEFEVTDSLAKVSYGAFYNAEKFKAFYTMQGGVKNTTATLANVMLDGGVLYLATDLGYNLVCYPMDKADKEYVIPEGVIRIEFTAATGNMHLQKVTMPSTMKNIGNLAFYDCTALTEVRFKSYFAPVLEGTLSGNLDMLPSDVMSGKFPNFNKLYKYDYYYYMQCKALKEAQENGESYTPPFGVPYPLAYANFVGLVTSQAASNLTYVTPDNCEGYDSALYNAYFKKSQESTGKTAGKYATEFIDAVNRLPSAADRFDKTLIDNATTAYNALIKRQDELKYVDQAIIDNYLKLFSQYNVDVTINSINKLVGIDATERSYKLIAEAVNNYNALSDEDKQLITNFATLQQAINVYNQSANAGNVQHVETNNVWSAVAMSVANVTALVAIAVVFIKRLLGGNQ